MKLSKNFTLQELIVSQTASRLSINNNPDDERLKNLILLAETLEEIRSITNKAIIVSSGYRSKELNLAIGGSTTSSHMQGLGADIFCPKYGTPKELVQEIAVSDIKFDQLILEFDNWVHIGIRGKDRHQILTASKENGKTVYRNGIV